MVRDEEVLQYCMDALSEKGSDKSQVVLKEAEKHELNVDSDEISLFRTTYNTELDLIGIDGNKKGSTSVNKTDREAIDDALERVEDLVATSSEDEAYDIAPWQQPQTFDRGPGEPDPDRMHQLLTSFLGDLEDAYPEIMLIQSVLDFERTTRRLVNSNGVDFSSDQGVYHLHLWFASKDGEKTTSFNGLGLSLSELERELLDFDFIQENLHQSVQHLQARPFDGKFTGDVIIVPQTVVSLLSMYGYLFLGNQALISGTSRLKDSLNEQVASSRLSVHSKPTSEEICDGYFITPDGFAAEDVTIIEDGVLRSFLLDQYGANKTGRERASTAGGAYVVDAGEQALEELIGGVQRGLLVTRYSGGTPNPNGDFSGVAKNSFYIEDGQLAYPVTETMISGNLLEVFENIRGISEESVDFGSAVAPWILSEGVTISGK